MGRDKRDRISVATYVDISNTLRDIELTFDTHVELRIEATNQGKGLWVTASALVWLNPSRRQEFTVQRPVSSVTLELPSVVYATCMRLYHDIDLAVHREPRRTPAVH